ncbi:MAG: helix-turn-helix domain-containing protein [Nocardioidaceae bacterium]|nr:helix-turn-helix domain-containing protein [Nocardioidaceae bacterium]
MTSATEWLSLEDIAAELDVPLRTLYAQRSRGIGPRGYKLGKHVRVKRADFEAWLESHADPTPAA